MLPEAFEKFGFGDKHQRVYMALVDAGKLTATQLSKRTNIPRATLYSVIEQLIEYGVVSREHIRGSALFVVNPPEAFLRLVERQREEIELKEKAARHIVETIAPYLQKSSFGVPKIQVFEGKQSIENMLYDFLPLWRKSTAQYGGNTLWGFQDQTFVESYFRWHKHLWATMTSEENICLFSNPADIEKELQHKISHREVRPLPEGVQFMSSIWIYGEYLVMGMTRDKPHYCVQVKDTVLSANLRTIFELLWNAKLQSPESVNERKVTANSRR